jgi:hypothetical protein
MQTRNVGMESGKNFIENRRLNDDFVISYDYKKLKKKSLTETLKNL